MPRYAPGLKQVRYMFVGGICALINNTVLIGGDWLGFGYVVLAVAGFSAASSTGYLLHSLFTFRRKPGWAGYFGFMGGAALGIPVSLFILTIFRSGLEWPMWIAAPGMTAVMIIYHYCNAVLMVRLGSPARLVRLHAEASE